MWFLVLFILFVLWLEMAMPGFLPAVYDAIFANIDPVRGFLYGVIAVVLTWTIPYSLGRTGLARQQRDAAVDRAETQYQKDKGWL